MEIMPKHQAVKNDIECDHWGQTVSENSTNIDLITTTFLKNIKLLADCIKKYIQTHNLDKGDHTSVNHHDNLGRYGLTTFQTISKQWL